MYRKDGLIRTPRWLAEPSQSLSVRFLRTFHPELRARTSPRLENRRLALILDAWAKRSVRSTWRLNRDDERERLRE